MNLKLNSLTCPVLILVLSAFSALSGAASAQCCGRVSLNQPRIVGGTGAPRGAYPWMTALIERGQTPAAGQFCGAALIQPQWVLTAAHCIADTTAARLDVIVGAYSLTEANGGGQRVQVTQILKHPGYGDDANGNTINDVALLKLAVPVTNVAVIPLVDSAARVAAGMPCKGMGFGAMTEGGSGSTMLLHVDLGFFSLTEANKVYGSLSDMHLAAGIAAGGRDTCQGDSGGPLVVADGKGGWMHAGIVSFGDGCAKPGIPGVYSSTLKFTPWILQNIGGQPPILVDDAGNTVAAASTKPLGTAIAGKLESAEDVDVYKFTVTGPGSLTAVSTGTTALSGQWLDPAGASLASQAGVPNVNLRATATSAGSYYFSVRGATAATVGSYSLTASFVVTPVVGAPEIDLLGLNSVAISDGDAAATSAKGTVFGPFTVGATVSQVFTIKNTGTAALALSPAQITGAGASQFRIATQPAASVAAGRSTTFTVAYTPTAAGAHSATISIPNNDANENPYDFQITGSATALNGDDHGNTLATATVITVPSSRPGNLTSRDIDIFKFTLAAPATVTLKTTGGTDTYGVLYNSKGTFLTEADDISAADANFSIKRQLAAGTYFLEVSGYDDTVTGAYTVQISK